MMNEIEKNKLENLISGACDESAFWQCVDYYRIYYSMSTENAKEMCYTWYPDCRP